MNRLFTCFRINLYYKLLCACFAMCIIPGAVTAQLTVSANKTAAILASTLVGSGITIISPTLTCAGNANGTFSSGAIVPLGFASGIVLTNGDAKDTLGGFGVSDPSSTFANTGNGTPGDAQLTALIGGVTTSDACVLQFDFKPAGDTIKFKYVFGSEEYTDYTCSPYNDVFAFFISGGTYATPTNLALVPGTTIPVAVNSVNCGPTGIYTLPTCTAMGPGSPFCAYYVNNLTGPVAPYVTYDGLTTVLTAIAAVSPCDTYHLKLAIADASDDAFDSGVFIEGGSLTSNTTTAVTATGTSGLPYCIRGCAPGDFVFTTPNDHDTAITIHYIIAGTAVNGYDYTTIPTSVTLPPHVDTVVLNINTLPVTPVGPVVITLEIQVPDPCHPGVYTTGAIANLTILDSFSFHIVTPDTAICLGQFVHIIAVGDSIFNSILHYAWTPSATVSTDTTLITNATPTVTTIYTLTASTAAALGCTPEHHSIKITVYDPPTLTVDSALVKTCVGIPVQLHVYAAPSGIPYTYLWSPATSLSGASIWNPIVDPAVPGNVTYTVSAHPTAISAGCASTINVTVHTEPNDFALFNHDTLLCLGQFVNVSASGSAAFTYAWTPTTGVSNPNIINPVITPPAAANTYYTITANYAACPPMIHGFDIRTYSPPALTVDSALVKTCVGIPVQLHVYAVPDTLPNTYLWSPPTDLNYTTISNPIVDPSVPGDVTYTITVNPTALPGCFSTTNVTVHTLPNDFTLFNHDTVICIGAAIQVSINGSSEFTWAWVPPTGVSDPTLMQPTLSPTVTTSYTVTASYAHCPDMVHHINVEVDIPAATYIHTDTICLGVSDSIDLTVQGAGYYHYLWTPATYISNDTLPNPLITPTVEGTFSWGIVIQPHAAGCAIIDSVHVLVVPAVFTITPTSVSICKGDQVVVSGTPYVLFSYQWLPTTGIPISNIINPTIKPDTSADYVVTASYAKCPPMHDTLKIDVQPVPTISIGGNRGVCKYDTLHLNAIVGPAWYQNYSYAWTPDMYLDNSNTSTVVFSADTTVMVICTVTTTAKCAAVDSALITVHPINFAHLDSNIRDFCPHDSAFLRPYGGVSYAWSPSLYLSSSTALIPVIRPITSQTYSIIATSQYGCLDTLIFTAIVHPAAEIFLGDSVTLYPGETYQISPQTNCTVFSWSPPAGLSYPFIANPIASPEVSTKYLVYGSTEWGCTVVDSIDIYVDPETLLALPNAFTPGVGVNNEFKIIKRGIATLNYFRIFNRWGNLVFQTSDIDKGWDGEYNSEPQPFGVYVYEVEAVTSTGKIFTKHGNTTLIR